MTTRETLNNGSFVTPAEAGVYKSQEVIDSRLRGNDINQGIHKLILYSLWLFDNLSI